jgi:sugar phosphate isomerase/epimerase
MSAETNWILWSGTVGFDTPIEERAHVASSGGFSRFTISPSDVHRERSEVGHAKEILRIARDHGVEVMMDPVVNWHPASDPGPFRSAAFSLDEMLGMCEETGTVAMTAVALIDSLVPDEEMSAHFAYLYDRAAQIGVEVALEFIPMTAVGDLRFAWEIIQEANRDNGGILFDTWHYFRGHPDLQLLGQIPGRHILAVQVNDASEPISSDLWYETLHREIPGAGSFDLAPVIYTLARSGGLNWVGAEVIHPDLAAVSPVEAATSANRPTRKLVTEVLRRASSTASKA